MIQTWIGIALLAGSWLLGLDYFYAANPVASAVLVAAGVISIAVGATGDAVGDLAIRPTRRWTPWIAIVLLLPAAWYATGPYRIGPVLLIVGLLLEVANSRRRAVRRFADAGVISGVVLLVQGLAVELYAAQTARCHDVPWPLPELLAAVMRLLGSDATADGSNIVLRSVQNVHRLGATWELLLDPATLLLFVGGVVVVALQLDKEDPSGGNARLFRRICTLALIAAAWLPLRAALLIAVYLHRVARSDPGQPLHAMNHFFSPWVLLALLVPPAVLMCRFVRWRSGSSSPDAAIDAASSEPQTAKTAIMPLLVASLLIALATASFTAAIYWSPIGARRDGRVMVVERHSKWEPTTKPYDTTWFAEPPLYGEASGYNYAAIYRYLGQYYEMSRLLDGDQIDDATLSRCDVLVVKIPTERYSEAESQAVVRFVERGGSVLFIGDHTNITASSTAMNDMTRPMGFTFRDDLLFTFGDAPYEQSWKQSALPHPCVQHVPPLGFAVSCSVDPGRSHGRAIMTSTGLWSMGPEYHFENFHPVPEHHAGMRCGAFVQAWAAQHGKGRAVAFTDSTIFSNFCVFQPGKAELMLGMIEWLNHANPAIDPCPWLLGVASIALAAGIWFARWQRDTWILLLACGACGWAVASVAIAAAHQQSMPPPKTAGQLQSPGRRGQVHVFGRKLSAKGYATSPKNGPDPDFADVLPKTVRPEPCVVIDRVVSKAPLANGLYTTGGQSGYGLLEAAIPRLGCHTVRKEPPEVFLGDIVVTILPSGPVGEAYQRELEAYVSGGGKLLVIDSPENSGSTANDLLRPFGLTIRHDRKRQGRLQIGAPLRAVDVAQACEVGGGQPIAKLGRATVAATVKHGKGLVVAIGFGGLWNDGGLGQMADEPASGWMLEPGPVVKDRYNVLFYVLRSLLDGSPLLEPPSTPDTSPLDELPLKESGPAET